MATTLTGGMRGTFSGGGNYDGTNQSFIRDVSKKVYTINPTQTQLIQVLLGHLNKKKVTNFRYEIATDHFRDQTLVYDGSNLTSSISTVTLTLNDAAASVYTFFQIGQTIFNNRTRDFGIVTNIAAGAASSKDITIKMADGTTTWTALSANDILIHTGNALEQGGTFQTAKSTQITYPYNVTEIFVTPFSVDRTTIATANYGGNDWDRQKRKAALEHKLAIQYAMLYNKRSDVTSAMGSSRNEYLTGGLWDTTNIMTTAANNMTASTTITEAAFLTALAQVFSTGSDHKIMFANNYAMATIMGFARSNIRINAGKIPSYGLNFLRYESHFGILDMVRVPQMKGVYDEMIFIEPENFGMAVLRDTAEYDISMPNVDGLTHAFVTECGLWLAAPDTHATYRRTS